MFKKRKLFKKILKYLNTKEMLIIHGARQVGKTTLMKMIIAHLKQTVNPKNIIYMDMEDPEYLQLCNEGVESVMNFLIENNVDTKKKVYLFIDEIHYINNVSGFLKLFYDRYGKKCKIIASGSSSFEIKKKFKESMSGRFFSFELFPLDFEEFLYFNEQQFNLNKQIKSTLIHNKLKNLFRKYILWGSYPRISFFNDNEIKFEYIKGLINTYVFKDIRDIGNIKNIQKFNNLLIYLANNNGLINLSNISNEINMTRQTLYDYLFILEKTYIIKSLYPFHSNKSTELKKMHKIYFEDTGIRRFLFGNMLKNNKISGLLFENAIYLLLKSKYENIYYWRNKQKNEIDFIVNNDGELKAFEVKLTNNAKKNLGFQAFANKYKKSELYIITLNKNNKIKTKYNQLYPWEIYSI